MFAIMESFVRRSEHSVCVRRDGRMDEVILATDIFVGDQDYTLTAVERALTFGVRFMDT